MPLQEHRRPKKMDRRGFMKAILASGIAPYAVTTAGVLMPVRALAVNTDQYTYSSDAVAKGTVLDHVRLRQINFRDGNGGGGGVIVREHSHDGVVWVPEDRVEVDRVLMALRRDMRVQAIWIQ